MSGTRVWLVLTTLALVNVLNFVDRQLPFILAEQIKRDLRMSDTQLGLLGGLAFAACYSLAALPLARLADRWSARKVLVGAVALWSAMTSLGGLASSFLQLAMTRTGVALGEAAATPSAHAIIARALPVSMRGRAIGLFSMGAPIGTMLGLGLGGWLADAAGWRQALLAAGFAGVITAVIVALVIPGDRAPQGMEVADEATLTTVRRLLLMPGFRWMFAGMCLVGMGGYAFLSFNAPYLIRLQGLTMTRAGLLLGLVNGLCGLVGTVLGGYAYDRQTRAGTARRLRLSVASMLLAVPTSLAAYFADGATPALALLIPTSFALTYYTSALYGAAHLQAGQGREATASSLLIIGAGLFGGILGPLAVGSISDLLAPQFGTASLRWGMIVVPVSMLLASFALWRADLHASRLPSGTAAIGHGANHAHH